jgi:hypothetical protein
MWQLERLLNNIKSIHGQCLPHIKVIMSAVLKDSSGVPWLPLEQNGTFVMT